MPLAEDTNDRIEDYMGTLMRNMVEEDAIKQERFVQDSGWVAAELEHWKQRCEELEIELECTRNQFTGVDWESEQVFHRQQGET
jgi:hypothetical protein